MSFALKNHLFEKSEWKSLDRKLNEKMTENPLCYSYTRYYDDDAGTESNCTKDENVFASKLKRGLFFLGIEGSNMKRISFLAGLPTLSKKFLKRF